VTSTEQGGRKYDEIADSYEEIFFYVADLGQRLIDFADPAPGTSALDVGAGRGAVARAALARGCEVTAVDASLGMVSRLAPTIRNSPPTRWTPAGSNFPTAPSASSPPAS
jgi:ubiquinone/menaquinone biosynthesis C-methylase UbiE